MHPVVHAVVCAALALCAGCTRLPAKEVRSVGESQSKLLPSKTPPATAETSPSGLVSQVQKPGSGDKRPRLHDQVRLNFAAWNGQGEQTDSSEKRGGPVTFAVAGVIAGWTEALQQMRVGEQRRLWIPDHLVYPGRPGFPRAMAIFDLELLEILEGEAPLPAPPDVAAAPADATLLSSGLAYKLLASSGSDDKPNAWDRVRIYYTGWTTAGVTFESSGHKRPAVFDVSHVMPGWREALQRLAAGDRARVWIPEALAYQGRAGQPQGSVVFDLELVSIERRPAPPEAPAQLAAPQDAKQTQSGLSYRVLKHGTGKTKPTRHDRVAVHYSAWTSDGRLFDSSIVKGQAATVPVSRVIPGWAEGLQLMVEGDKALFWIPEKLAYAGRDGAPRGQLLYEVELLQIAR